MVKIAWYCKTCLWLSVSDSKDSHKMDTCLCKKTSLDLEEGYARMIGDYVPFAKLEDGGKRWVPLQRRRLAGKTMRKEGAAGRGDAWQVN